MEHGPLKMYFLKKNGDIPASYVSLPEGIQIFWFPDTPLQRKKRFSARLSIMREEDNSPGAMGLLLKNSDRRVSDDIVP